MSRPDLSPALVPTHGRNCSEDPKPALCNAAETPFKLLSDLSEEEANIWHAGHTGRHQQQLLLAFLCLPSNAEWGQKSEVGGTGQYRAPAGGDPDLQRGRVRRVQAELPQGTTTSQGDRWARSLKSSPSCPISLFLQSPRRQGQQSSPSL